MPNSNSPANSSNVNTVQTALQQNSINTVANPEILLVVNNIRNVIRKKVLPVKIANENKSVTVNALFDSGSDCALLPQNVASYLNSIGKEQSITSSNAISQSNKSKVKSKLVNFSLSSKFHTMRTKFKNVCTRETQPNAI